MLLIDGVKYVEWKPEGENAEEELEQMVKEHAKDIFGENSIYLDKKQKLKSLAGVGSIPDGLVIMFGNVPEWHIVEVELSSHDPYGHIVPQVDRFLNGIDNRDTRNKIIEALYDAINGDEFLKRKTRQTIGMDKDVHKFLSDLIARPPTITIVIEEYTSPLREALKKYTQKKVVEFRTFSSVGTDLAVHAHLFVPLYTVSPLLPPPPIHTPAKSLEIKPHRGEIVKARKVTFEELVSAGLLRDQQILYFYNTRLFTDERAQIIVSSDKLKYERDGHTYSKSELASILLEKHGFKRGGYPVQGPKFWKTEAGRLLDDLNEDIRIQRGERV